MDDYKVLLVRLRIVKGVGDEAATAIEALQARLESSEADYAAKCAELEIVHDAALAKLRELEGQVSVGWLISYEYLASTENIDGSVKKFKENWRESSFLSEFKDAEIDAPKYRSRHETPLYASPVPAKTLSEPEIRAMWRNATIELCSHENCYVRGAIDAQTALKGGA